MKDVSLLLLLSFQNMMNVVGSVPVCVCVTLYRGKKTSYLFSSHTASSMAVVSVHQDAVQPRRVKNGGFPGNSCATATNLTLASSNDGRTRFIFMDQNTILKLEFFCEHWVKCTSV